MRQTAVTKHIRAVWRYKRCRLVVVGLLSALLSVGLLGTFSPWTARIGPGEVQLSLSWHLRGSSTLELPPLGDVSASTHVVPLNVKATLLSVDTRQVQQTVASDKPADVLEDEVRAGLDSALPKFVARTLLISLVIGLVCAALVSRNERRALLVGALSSSLVVGGLLAATWRSYDVDAFAQPQYTGSLTEAPRVLAAIQRHVGGIDDARRKISTLSSQVTDLYRSAESQDATQNFDTSILHVSDLHSNPVGFELTRNLATSFGVDAVIDTGDVTSFGLPIESRAVSLLSGMPVPYYVIPGNHDSPQIRQALANTPGVTSLDNETADINGIRVLGVGDPTFTATNETSTDTANNQKRVQASSIRSELLNDGGIDLLAVHSMVQAEASFGAVPLIVAGHAHQRSVVNREQSIGLVVGSTGAGGVGAFTVTEEPQYEAEILRFQGSRLVAVDYVVLSGSEGNFTVVRSVTPLDPIPADNRPIEDPRPFSTTSTVG